MSRLPDALPYQPKPDLRAARRKRQRKRREQRRAVQYGELAEYIRQLPCCACHAAAPSDPHHVRSKGAGGKAHANLVPLCRSCHQRGESPGWSWKRFEEYWAIDLKALAEKYQQWFESDPQPLGF